MSTIFDGSPGSLLFVAKVRELMDEVFTDPDFTTRQFIDDHYRATGISYHLKHHILEPMVLEAMEAIRNAS